MNTNAGKISITYVPGRVMPPKSEFLFRRLKTDTDVTVVNELIRQFKQFNLSKNRSVSQKDRFLLKLRATISRQLFISVAHSQQNLTFETAIRVLNQAKEKNEISEASYKTLIDVLNDAHIQLTQSSNPFPGINVRYANQTSFNQIVNSNNPAPQAPVPNVVQPRTLEPLTKCRDDDTYASFAWRLLNLIRFQVDINETEGVFERTVLAIRTCAGPFKRPVKYIATHIRQLLNIPYYEPVLSGKSETPTYAKDILSKALAQVE